ncbi:MAG TPA: response regulator transcription factor [Marmoricola sp.]|nr:response regulator transcription factor [Marmoricola sp.]
MPRVLIVEDEETYREALEFLLRKDGFEVITATTGPEALDLFERAGADLILLDLMLPGLSGTEVCRQIRQTSSVPIIMVTAKDDEIDKVVGLEIGADDYVTKPVYPRVLLARIRSLLRRLEPRPSEPITRRVAGPLSLDRGRREAAVESRSLRLTGIEFDLLWMLAERPGEVVSRERLYGEVLGTEWDGLDRGVDIHVSRIRHKLVAVGLEAGAIKSVRGAGYLLTLS